MILKIHATNGFFIVISLEKDHWVLYIQFTKKKHLQDNSISQFTPKLSSQNILTCI